MEIEKLLKFMVDKKASDMFLTIGIPPTIKVDGKLIPLPINKLTNDLLKKLACSIMTERLQKEFAATQESNFAVSYPNVG